MVALITGGRKASSEENRQAVLDTWADNHTYWATHEPIASKNVLWLPDVAETGGYRMLGRKGRPDYVANQGPEQVGFEI